MNAEKEEASYWYKLSKLYAQQIADKDTRITELEESRDEWQSRWMAAEKSGGEALGEKIAERELHTLEVDELTKRIAELEKYISGPPPLVHIHNWRKP